MWSYTSDWLISISSNILVRLGELALTGFRKRDSEVVQPPCSTFKEKQIAELEKTEVSEIAERFQTVLKLMNEGRRYDKFTVSTLARIMGLSRTSELEEVFHGKKDPLFEFKSKFCETFSVNYEWLEYGSGHPYDDNEQTDFFYLSNYFSEIKELDPEGIIFVRAETQAAQAFIILKLSDWEYKVLPEIWHISGNIGNGGEKRLFNLYKLIIKIDGSDFYSKCEGITLPKEEFDALSSGERFPGKYAQAIGNDYWWDDLTDVYHELHPSLNNGYERMYGRSFIEAQEIIKRNIEQFKRLRS